MAKTLNEVLPELIRGKRTEKAEKIVLTHKEALAEMRRIAKYMGPVALALDLQFNLKIRPKNEAELARAASRKVERERLLAERQQKLDVLAQSSGSAP